MDIIIQPQHWSAFLAIAIMIIAIVFAFIKKFMITYALIIANIIIFIISSIYTEELVIGYLSNYYIDYNIMYAGLGFKPAYLSLEYSPQLYTIITSQFIHSDFPHILGNMLVLFFVGVALEERIGSKKFLGIFLLTGIIAALAQSFIGGAVYFNMTGEEVRQFIPMVGASGAIFGILGALVYSYTNDKIVMPIPVFIIMIVRRIRVLYAVLLFTIFETVIILFEAFGGNILFSDNTAHFAHLGGLIGGIILAAIILGRNKTHTEKGQTLYYDSYQTQRPRNIDFSKLDELATTKELKDMLEKIKNESVPQVQDIWLEHFLDKSNCPNCNTRLNHFDKKIWCEKCGYKSQY